MKLTTVADITAKFQTVVADPESANEEAQAIRTEELMKLSKSDLTAMIISAESRNSGSVKVGDLAKMILQDEEFITASHETVAQAVRELIPGSQTSYKSIASYVSKKREEWDLPDRIQVRTARPKKPAPEVETETTED